MICRHYTSTTKNQCNLSLQISWNIRKILVSFILLSFLVYLLVFLGEPKQKPNLVYHKPPFSLGLTDCRVARSLQFALRCRKAASSGWDDEMLESGDSFAIESVPGVPGDFSYQLIYLDKLCNYGELFPKSKKPNPFQIQSCLGEPPPSWAWLSFEHDHFPSFSSDLKKKSGQRSVHTKHLSDIFRKDLEIHWSEIDQPIVCQTPANDDLTAPTARSPNGWMDAAMDSHDSLVTYHPWKLTAKAPEKGSFWKEFHFPTINFQGICWYFRGVDLLELTSLLRM